MPQFIQRFSGFHGSEAQMNHLYRSTGIGLGDLVFTLSYFTGISFIVWVVSRKFKRDCGCEKRRRRLNQFRFYTPFRHVPKNDPRPALEPDGGGPPVRPEQLLEVSASMSPSKHLR